MDEVENIVGSDEIEKRNEELEELPVTVTVVATVETGPTAVVVDPVDEVENTVGSAESEKLNVMLGEDEVVGARLDEELEESLMDADEGLDTVDEVENVVGSTEAENMNEVLGEADDEVAGRLDEELEESLAIVDDTLDCEAASPTRADRREIDRMIAI